MLLVHPFLISVHLMELHQAKFLPSPVAGFVFSGPCNLTTTSFSFMQDLLSFKCKDEALNKLDALTLSAICS